MTTLLTNRKARRRGIIFMVLLIITFLLMAFSANPAVLELKRGLQFALRPIQGAVASFAADVTSVFGSIGEINQLRIDNAALRDENTRLQNDNTRLQQLKSENEQLTALLQLQTGFDHKTVAVRVIGRELLPTSRVVTIDKGTSDGLEDGDVVIVAGGAVAGRISDIGPNFAKVTLISDPSSTVIAQLAQSGQTGEVGGESGGVMTMKNIDSSVTIALDEEVFTAGLELAGGIRSPYPKGLILGSVVDVQRDANDVVQTAFVAPAANLDTFELALVITDYSGGLPPADQQPQPCGTSGPIPSGEVPCYTPSPAPTKTPKP
ncbi:MAG: rod shape-determining protein MreC [Chloroflexota bacterium]